MEVNINLSIYSSWYSIWDRERNGESTSLRGQAQTIYVGPKISQIVRKKPAQIQTLWFLLTPHHANGLKSSNGTQRDHLKSYCCISNWTWRGGGVVLGKTDKSATVVVSMSTPALIIFDGTIYPAHIQVKLNGQNVQFNQFQFKNIYYTEHTIYELT